MSETPKINIPDTPKNKKDPNIHKLIVTYITRHSNTS